MDHGELKDGVVVVECKVEKGWENKKYDGDKGHGRAAA